MSQNKAEVIRENIESTLEHAIETQEQLMQTTDEKEQNNLIAKNEGRAQAIPSLIRDMKKAEAEEQLQEDLPKIE